MFRLAKLVVLTITVSLSFAITVSANTVCSLPSNNVASLKRQDATTFLGIQALVQQTMQGLQNVGITLGGESNIIVGNASQELNNKLQELKGLVKEDVSVPIASLGLDVQELARKLTSSVTQLNAILTAQQACLYQNASLILSSVSNITQDLKRAVPFDKTKPQLSYFQFDDLLPRAVPISGGRLTVSGVKLWTKAKYPPIVKLQSPDRQTTYQTPQPQPAGSDGSFSIVLDGTGISNNSGECLQLSVEAREETGFIFKKVVTTPLAIPMCVSPSYKTEFVVEAGIAYDITKTIDPEEREEQEFRVDNNSCENRKTVSGLQRFWNLPAGARIVSISERTGQFHRHQSSVNMNITGSNTVAANGWIDTASCTCVPVPFLGRQCTLNSETIFQKFVTPKIQYEVTNSKSENATSAKKSMSLPNTQISLLIPKSLETSSTIFWFRVTKYVNGVATTTKFESGRTTVNTNGGSSNIGILDNLQVAGSFNPKPVNGNAELIVTIQAPACGL